MEKVYTVYKCHLEYDVDKEIYPPIWEKIDDKFSVGDLNLDYFYNACEEDWEELARFKCKEDAICYLRQFKCRSICETINEEFACDFKWRYEMFFYEEQEIDYDSSINGSDIKFAEFDESMLVA